VQEIESKVARLGGSQLPEAKELSQRSFMPFGRSGLKLLRPAQKRLTGLAASA
jgi:hypothetical protein